MQSPQIQRAISDAVTGTTGLKNIAVTFIRKIEVPWPSAEARDGLVQTTSLIADAVETARRQTTAAHALTRSIATTAIEGAIDFPASYDEHFLPPIVAA